MKWTFSNVKNMLIHYTDRILFKYYYRKLVSKRRKTSISDDHSYPVVCLMAAKSEHFFKKFRRNPTYNDILEHVSQKQGQDYLDVINQNEELAFTDADWDNFIRNDLYGSPAVYSYTIGTRTVEISPTTLRYAKVLQDIAVLFNAHGFRSIAEIGIGYAGECRMLTSYFSNIETYSLFDLPEVLALAKRYLGKFGKATIDKVQFVDGTQIDAEGDYDFVISNYAFSELIRDIQDLYLRNVILKSKAGYMTWNTLSHDMLDGYSLEELLKKIPGSSTIAEVPLTKEGNCIILWGNRR
ncbi:MAG: putative sugar O-methyltransferase [Lachnospiraceae bacterium]|nr:putative sugar O-methyltransferase [Lachnospiraceae bacterium]